MEKEQNTLGTIEVSILIPVYNHEKYIEECLKSILLQNVHFNYEVLVGEDCSSDGSRELLKKIESEFPSRFKFIYHEKNYGMVGNYRDLLSRVSGKYHIFLEGDDYWTDPDKLQLQYDYMQSHPECSAVAHKCVVVNENSVPTGEHYPQCEKESYSFEDYLKDYLPGQTATIMSRTDAVREIYAVYEPYRKQEQYPEDRVKAFLLLCAGKVGCIDKAMSAYRHVTSGGTSFSAINTWNAEAENQMYLFFLSLFEFSRSLGIKEALNVSGKMYYRFFFIRCIRHFKENKELFSFSNFFKQLLKEKEGAIFFAHVVKYAALYKTHYYRKSV